MTPTRYPDLVAEAERTVVLGEGDLVWALLGQGLEPVAAKVVLITKAHVWVRTTARAHPVYEFWTPVRFPLGANLVVPRDHFQDGRRVNAGTVVFKRGERP